MQKNPQTEKEFLREYDSSVFKSPITTVDTVIFTVIDDHLHVLTVKRAEHPYKASWALVGGFIDIDRDDNIELTAKRKLFEKTGVKTPYLEQFCVIGNNKRDPRGWSVTAVYFALISSINVQLQSGKDVTDIKWTKVIGGKVKDKLAFDHAKILLDCYGRLRNKVLYTSLPIYLMPQYFTLGELQNVYEVILNQKIEHKSFRRRILNADILFETNEMRRDGKRPAQLYSIKKNHPTHFFVRNIEGVNLSEQIAQV